MKDILKADIRDRAEIDLEALFRGPIGFETDKPGRIQLLNSQGPTRDIASGFSHDQRLILVQDHADVSIMRRARARVANQMSAN